MSLTVGGSSGALVVTTNQTGSSYALTNFSSSNTDVAEVTHDLGGYNIVPVGEGEATITLRLRGNKAHDYQYYEAYCTVSVTAS